MLHHPLIRIAFMIAISCAIGCGDSSTEKNNRSDIPDDLNSSINHSNDLPVNNITDNNSIGNNNEPQNNNSANNHYSENSNNEPPSTLIDGSRALDYVDPFIGSGGLGFGYASLTPAAQMPFGLVRLGPDTTRRGGHIPQQHFSGYHHDDPDIRGFSHLRFVGTGVWDYGNIRVLPHNVPPEGIPGKWYARMDKDSEQASPGYYRVFFPQENITTELTAAYHSGFHRYDFHDNSSGFITVDAGASILNEDVTASYTHVEPGLIEGWATHQGPYTGRARPFTVYFSMTVDPPAENVWVWQDGMYLPDQTSAEGIMTGAVLEFDQPDSPVEIRAGISIVDLDAARLNRETQLDSYDFEDIAKKARLAWQEKLHRVRLKGADETVNRIFYTALYNAYRMPTRFDGVDGRYRGLDGNIHTTDNEWIYYTDLSLWDTFRTLHPLLTLIDVDEQRDVLKSLQAMREQGGYFPRWPAALSYTGGMEGSWADTLFAEGALKGIDGVDYEDAYIGLRQIATESPPPGSAFAGRHGIEEYIEYGYITADSGSGSATRTLEYCWGDFAMANIAEYLGYNDDAELFRTRSKNYKNLFNPDELFFRGRYRDGSFDTADRTDRIYMDSSGAFVEGSAWHWRFYAFHDPDGLVDLFGKQVLEDALEEFFIKSQLGSTRPLNHFLPDMYYWHGNEPQLHVALLYHAVDRYDRLAYWVRQIQTRIYTDEPGGLPGNDDGGTLSSWYVFNALGLYPVAGSDKYLMTIPLVPYAEVETSSGVLTIEAPAAAPRDQHVTAIEVNDITLDGHQISHAELLDATLRFTLQDTLIDGNE